MKLLVDTPTFLWFLTADKPLSEAAAAALRAPDNDVWLSAVSFWEILVKHRLGRLPLPEPPSSYIPKQRKRHGIASLALREKAMAHLPSFPTFTKIPSIGCSYVSPSSTVSWSSRPTRSSAPIL